MGAIQPQGLTQMRVSASDVVGCDVAVEKPAEIAAQTARLFLGKQVGNRVEYGDRYVNFVELKARGAALWRWTSNRASKHVWAIGPALAACRCGLYRGAHT